MKTLNLTIDLSGIEFSDDKEYSAEKLVVNLIDQAIASSFDGRKTTSAQQREINAVMSALESSANGVVQLKDDYWRALLGWWDQRQLPPLTGSMRRLCDRVDRLLCPDNYVETT